MISLSVSEAELSLCIHAEYASGRYLWACVSLDLLVHAHVQSSGITYCTELVSDGAFL